MITHTVTHGGRLIRQNRYSSVKEIPDEEREFLRGLGVMSPPNIYPAINDDMRVEIVSNATGPDSHRVKHVIETSSDRTEEEAAAARRAEYLGMRAQQEVARKLVTEADEQYAEYRAAQGY